MERDGKRTRGVATNINDLRKIGEGRENKRQDFLFILEMYSKKARGRKQEDIWKICWKSFFV